MGEEGWVLEIKVTKRSYLIAVEIFEKII